MKKVIYYLCISEEKAGTVSRTVWEILKSKGILNPTDMKFHDREVMIHTDDRGNEYYFAQTEIPVCWDYPGYLPEMNEKFGDFDFAGMVTWHEGASAPPKVLTVHSLGDVNTGVFGPANPLYMRNLLHAMEKGRLAAGLDDFMAVTEATHWSGTVMVDHSPKLILEYPVPMVDIEVGSIEESWENQAACQALADALTQVFDDDGRQIHNLLCVGGVHFDPNFAQAVFTEWDNDGFGISHIIANQWLVAGEYENDHGFEFAKAAIEAIEGGIEAIAFHDKMKANYKDLVRALGEAYQIPVYRHQRIREPQALDW